MDNVEKKTKERTEPTGKITPSKEVLEAQLIELQNDRIKAFQEEYKLLTEKFGCRLSPQLIISEQGEQFVLNVVLTK